MAIMWVGGKPVEVTPEEALAFARVADAAPPTPPTSVPDPGTADPVRRFNIKSHEVPKTPAKRLVGLYAALDADGKAVLTKVLKAHPRALSVDEAKPEGDDARSRRLANAMSAITRAAGGPGVAIIKTTGWEAGARVIRYKLTDEMLRIAKEEKWGDNR